MSDIDFIKIASQAALQTDAEFYKQLASLTKLKTPEVAQFISNSKITNENALKTLGVISNATLANNEKASKIANVKNGIGFLIQLVSKVV